MKNMQPLEKTLRNRLERTVKDARDIAENAARAALEQLGVGEAAPFAHLSEQDRELRRRLRAHGRQLGDQRDGNTKSQEIGRLMEKVAYEHWHRMLFARFLAENNLLMYPDPEDPVAVTLEECEDLATDEGAVNGWELAARFAARMLPQIFRLDSPVFQLVLTTEHQQKLERLVAHLPLEVFAASDSLGWVYQFWQAKKKDEVNASEVKIGARELPAVTQLFTEPYMVSFLLDNSLGAWWAARRLTKSDFQHASNEKELREKACIPGLPLEFLRFAQQEDGTWTPAAGNFDDWPEQLADLKTLDPCCGSGHFLVAAFLMLVPMRVEQDDLSVKKAVDAVLRENIHGLELDQRCVELAAFALALTVWKYPGAGGYRILPELNVACSGLSISPKKERWLALAGDNTNLQGALEEIYNQFNNAPELGSLINPVASLGKDSLFELHWEEIRPLLTKVLAGEKDDELSEMGVVAKGLAKASSLLRKKYELVFTNVPYLSQGKQDYILSEFTKSNYKRSKTDLATVFVERCNQFIGNRGFSCLVTPQNWHYLASYKKLREKLLKSQSFSLVASLGDRAFSIALWDFGIALNILGGSCDADSITRFLSLESHAPFPEIPSLLKSDSLVAVKQMSLYSSDASRIMPVESFGTLLDSYCDPYKGLCLGDSRRFILYFWEFDHASDAWSYMQGSYSNTAEFDGQSFVVRWENGNGEYIAYATERLGDSLAAWVRGRDAWGRNGIVVRIMGSLPTVLYGGAIYNNNVSTLIPKDESNLPALWAFCSSAVFNQEVRKLNRKPSITDDSFVRIPFDLGHWTKVAEKKYPNGLPKPYTDNPNQWIFHGHPCGSVVWDENNMRIDHGALRTDGTVLHVTVARLLGYRWPAELDANMEMADEQREWVHKCELLVRFADEDGIVCISPVRGEASASDRLLNLLAAAYGDAWSNDILGELLMSVGHAGKTLESWLQEKFFTQHCKLFQHRPFIWHICDGLRDGFAALVNYHKLDAKLLETLIYTYLGDWSSRQKQDIVHGVDGAHERLVAAENLKKRLELILAGEVPYDIFVRWKPLEKQPIGWNPDLNDGVRLNIRPFLTVPDVGKKGAGVLRDRPKINWNKDRGKDVESAPWYHMFNGDRINDYHLSLAEKRASRE